jgi:hypothetical protein
MAQNDKLLYPFALGYLDNPDFGASISNFNIGIDVVEAVPQNKSLVHRARNAVQPGKPSSSPPNIKPSSHAP